MKGPIILKSLVAVLLIGLLPKLSLATGGKPNIIFRKTLMNCVQDTLPPNADQTAVNKDGKKVNTIKVLPNPHRQPIPVPLKVKVPQVKIIKPLVKPVIKILH
jgi:hypothetical protein